MRACHLVNLLTQRRALKICLNELAGLRCSDACRREWHFVRAVSSNGLDDDSVAEQLRSWAGPVADTLAGLEEVEGGARGHDAVAGIVRVALHEVAHPPRRRGDVARRPLRYQVEVLVDLPYDGGVAPNVLQVRLHQRQQAGVIVALAQQDFRCRHFLVLVAEAIGAFCPSAKANTAALFEILQRRQRRGRGGGGGPGSRRRAKVIALRWSDVFSEVELLRGERVTKLRPAHVFLNLGQGYI